jgi:PAS domain S-box-containing protein
LKKPYIRPTNIETNLKDNDFIVSKTDVASKIKYGNEIFIKISGWSEEEILNKPHNILRHPDMPQSAFKCLYDHFKNGQEWFGYVKNIRKDGGFYWVFANMTPSYDVNGKIIGYYSVRRKPIDGFKNIIEPLYKKISDIEKSSGMDAAHKELKKILESKNLAFNELMIKIQKGEINEL